jgi:hypothetical protein
MTTTDAQLTNATAPTNVFVLQLIVSLSLQMEDVQKIPAIQPQTQRDTVCTLVLLLFQAIQLMQTDSQRQQEVSHVIKLHVTEDNHRLINAFQAVTLLTNANVLGQPALSQLAKTISANQLDNPILGQTEICRQIVQQITFQIVMMETNVTTTIATLHGFVQMETT